MAKEKELKDFKIGDAVKRPVTPQSAAQQAPSKKKDKPEKQESASVGFPNIERIIEADSLDVSGLKARVGALDELAKKGDMKQKPAAKKALLAYQRSQELLDYLWSTKAALAGQTSAPAEAKGAKAPKKGK
jgi:hypothetical protein